MKKFCFIIVLLFAFSCAYAIEVGGHLTEDTTWSPDNNPYMVVHDVFVDEDVTLTILPGTVVKFNSTILVDENDFSNFIYYNGTNIAKMLWVDGKLIAEGTEEEPITFTRAQDSFYPEEQDPNTTPVAGDILSVTNFPNPFNPTTTISFDLTSESNVNITVYNVKGQKVKQLMNEQLSVGQHSIEWSGKDTNNKSVSSGIYFYKISSGKTSAMKKMLLLK